MITYLIFLPYLNTKFFIVPIEDKSKVDRVKLIDQLNDEDKKTIFFIVDKMLTNKKFKDFFNKNVAAL